MFSQDWFLTIFLTYLWCFNAHWWASSARLFILIDVDVSSAFSDSKNEFTFEFTYSWQTTMEIYPLNWSSFNFLSWNFSQGRLRLKACAPRPYGPYCLKTLPANTGHFFSIRLCQNVHSSLEIKVKFWE